MSGQVTTALQKKSNDFRWYQPAPAFAQRNRSSGPVFAMSPPWRLPS